MSQMWSNTSGLLPYLPTADPMSEAGERESDEENSRLYRISTRDFRATVPSAHGP